MKRLNILNSGLVFLGILILASCNKDEPSNASDATEGFQFKRNKTELIVTKFPEIEEVFIPETAEFNGETYPVTSIGDYASNSTVKKLHVPSSIRKIDVDAFFDKSSWEVYYVDELYIESLEDWATIDFGMDAYSGNTYIPPYSNANPVNNDTKVFVNGELLTKLVFSDDFPEIKPFAFNGFKVDEIVFPPPSWTSVKWSTFNHCEVPELHLENFTEIQDDVFSGSKIQKIYTGPNLESLGSYAFSSIHGLTDFYFQSSPRLWESVISSDYEKFTIHITEPLRFIYTAFDGSKIYCVDAPSLEVLLKSNFNSDQSPSHYISIDGVIQEKISVPPIFQSDSPNFAEMLVKEMTFEEGIEGIGLIMYMYDLEFLSLPSTLKSIKWIMGGFDDDIYTLKNVEIKALVPPENQFDYYTIWDEIYFENCILHVPAGCVEAYRNAPGWCNFQNITDEAYSGVSNIGLDSQPLDNRIYDLNGPQVSSENLQKGIHIQNGKKILVK